MNPEAPIISINTKDFTDPKIVASCSLSDASVLSSMLRLKSEDLRFRKLADGIYEIRPHTKKLRYPVLNLRNKRDTSYRYLHDFDKSHEFYQYIKKSRTSKIISDDYSAIRGRVLFDYINLWESDLKLQLVKSVSDKELNDKLKKFVEENKDIRDPYVVKNPDHRLASFDMFSLVKFIEFITSQHAIDIQNIAHYAVKLRKIRNACFHFRVVTPNDYRFVFNIIHLYQLVESAKSLEKAFSTISPAEKLLCLIASTINSLDSDISTLRNE